MNRNHQTYMNGSRSTLRTSVVVALLLLAPGAVTLVGQTPGGPGPGSTEESPKDTIRMQQAEVWRAGVYLGINGNIYSADGMRGMPGVPNCCPGFDGGSGFGVAAGGIVETPLNDWLGIGGRLYLSSYNGGLRDEEGTLVYDGTGSADGLIEHTIDADIWAVAVEPIVSLGLSESVRFFTGFRGDVVVRKQFAQREEIVQPDNVAFDEQGTRVRMQYDGAVPNGTSFQGAVTGGLRYDILFGESDEFVVAPEISAWFNPTDIISDESWRAHGIRFAVSAQYIQYDQSAIAEESAITPPSSGGMGLHDGDSLPEELPVEHSDEHESTVGDYPYISKP